MAIHRALGAAFLAAALLRAAAVTRSRPGGWLSYAWGVTLLAAAALLLAYREPAGAYRVPPGGGHGGHEPAATRQGGSPLQISSAARQENSQDAQVRMVRRQQSGVTHHAHIVEELRVRLCSAVAQDP